MKKMFMFLFIVIFSFNGLVYAEGEKTRVFDSGYFNKDEISERLKTIPEFLNNFISEQFVTEEMMRDMLKLLPAKRIEGILKNMQDCLGIVLADGTAWQATIVVFLHLTDKKSGADFVEAEKKLQLLKDAEYKDIILSSDYKTIPVPEGGSAFISRKKVRNGGMEQLQTMLITSKDTVVLELNVMAKQYTDDELIKLNTAIWNTLGKH
ncbi:MAG: hypothetical protein ABII75_02200 [Candidatus Omnitrophota bacterium]